MSKLVFLIAKCLCFTSIYATTVANSTATIDQEIDLRQDQLNKERLESQNEMVESQGVMIDDWQKYSQKVQDIKKTQERVEELKKEIQDLEKKKAELLKKSSYSHDVSE